VITRRRFLQTLGWSAAPFAMGAFVWRDAIGWAADRAGARILAVVLSPEERLKAHFDYLTLDPDGIALYFADYARYRGGVPRYRPLSHDVFTRYLLSTDFFRHGADESRVVRYVGLYDPDNAPCNNPLARFV
jgi:hypothetical protein